MPVYAFLNMPGNLYLERFRHVFSCGPNGALHGHRQSHETLPFYHLPALEYFS